MLFFFSSRRRHTRSLRDWSSDVCSSDLGGGGGSRRGPEKMIAYLSHELKLSDAQRDSVRAIFARHRPETDSLWAQVRPHFDSIKTRIRREIDAQLTPEQRVRHQQLIDQAEHHRKEREDSTKGKAQEGRN